MPDADTTAWVNAVVSDGGAVSGTQQGYVDNLIIALKGLGAWTPLERLWLYAGESDAHQAKIDVRSLSSHTVNGTNAFAAGGYTSNGSTGYINTNYNPNTAGLAVDAAAFGMYVRTEDTTGGNPVYFGEIVGGSHYLFLQINAGAASITFEIGGNAFPGGANPSGLFKGQWVGWTDSSTTQGIDRNEANVLSRAKNASGFESQPLSVQGFNNNGTTGQFSNAQFAAFWVTSDYTTITQVANVVNQYMKAWGVSVYASAPLFSGGLPPMGGPAINFDLPNPAFVIGAYPY